MTRVTVGMPVFNGGETVSRAIDSLLAQTYGNFELIISDNASTDGTEQICREYASKDSRIRYIRHKQNQGPLPNYRFVLEKAIGEFFFWAPHDDWWDPEFIRNGVDALEFEPKAAAAMGEVQYIDRDGEVFLVDKPPYNLFGRERHVLLRYIKTNYTDHLFYSFYRRKKLTNTYFFKYLYSNNNIFSTPEKILILETIMNGGFVDSPEMEYKNYYSFKKKKDLVEMGLNPGKIAQTRQSLFMAYLICLNFGFKRGGISLATMFLVYRLPIINKVFNIHLLEHQRRVWLGEEQ